mgnify:FL=1
MRAFFYNIFNDGGKRVSGHLSFQLLFLFFILFVSSFYTSVQGITPGKLISHKQSIPDEMQEANALAGSPSTVPLEESADNSAEELDDDLDTIDFKLCFDILAQNRLTYNHYNDSIFLIKEHDKWVNYFRRRAIKNHQIFAANQEILRGIKEFLTKHGDSIPEEIYLDFCHSIEQRYVRKKLYDPFLLVRMSRILEKGGAYLPDSVKYTNVFNLWRLYGYEQMWNLGGDVKYLRKAYQAGKAILSEDAKRYPHYDFALAGALEYMSNTIWLAFGLETIQDFEEHYRRLDDFLKREDLDEIVVPEQKRDLLELQQVKDEAFLCNIYYYTPTIIDSYVRDSLTRVVIDRNLQKAELSNLSFIRTVFLQMKARQISSREAWLRCKNHYHEKWLKYRDFPMNDRIIRDYLMPLYIFLIINDEADVPVSQKKKTIWKISQNMVTAFGKRKDFQGNTDFVRELFRLSTHRRLVKYLSYKQMVRFMSGLNVSTQVTTYAHSIHVAKIARVLLDGVLKYKPELLKGVFGYKNTEEILKHKRTLRSFIFSAGKVHDIGKNAIVSVVNNEYLPLTDDEFDIIRLHPRLGEIFLRAVPGLEIFHDTTVGHHKWYNGKGGYPADFDNTKSPIRFLIDIVTLSDCLQAATECVGRNYRISKTFEVVMPELRAGAGTKYNPDLVALIDAYPKLAKKLHHLVENGWIEIYYRIYSRFFDGSR